VAELLGRTKSTRIAGVTEYFAHLGVVWETLEQSTQPLGAERLTITRQQTTNELIRRPELT